MSNRNDMGSALDAGTVQAVARGTAWQRVKALGRYIISGIPPDNGFFGPNQPLAPVAQEEAAGRAWDFAVGYNLRITPKQEDEGVNFATLRGLAEACNVLRLVIETRKDQICRQDWEITARDGDATGDKAAIKAVTDFLALPDREHTWDAWLRMLVEDMLVIDAATVYPRATRGGGLYGLELIDGATIKRLLDISGRTPIPPDPAYQQILKGLPAVDYTADELIYMPRNPRTSRVYGLSPECGPRSIAGGGVQSRAMICRSVATSQARYSAGSRPEGGCTRWRRSASRLDRWAQTSVTMSRSSTSHGTPWRRASMHSLRIASRASSNSKPPSSNAQVSATSSGSSGLGVFGW